MSVRKLESVLQRHESWRHRREKERRLNKPQTEFPGIEHPSVRNRMHLGSRTVDSTPSSALTEIPHPASAIDRPCREDRRQVSSTRS